MRHARALLIGTTLALTLLLGGCGGKDSTLARDDAPTSSTALPTTASPTTPSPTTEGTGADPSVTAAQLESQISHQLTQAGEKPSSVQCPSDLAGVQGTTVECTLVLDGATTRARLTVTSVDGDTVNFNIELEDAG